MPRPQAPLNSAKARSWASPAGNFTMGSPRNEKDRDYDEGPQHAVTIGAPFAVGRFHVTRDQFAAFVAATGSDAGSKCGISEDPPKQRTIRSWQNPGFAQDGTHPAVCLSWNDAKAYVDWIGRETGKPYRLLTEAEWE
jgi:formylglycine-generating enzyme required for sulfatase activity